MRFSLELLQIVHHEAPEEGRSVFEGRLVDNHRGALRLDALHDTLDGALTEIVGIRLHRQAVDADHYLVLLVLRILRRVAVGSRDIQHAVRNEILPRPVRLHNRLDQILRNVLIVRQQLLRILRQAVSAVTERRIVVVRPDAGIQTDAVNDLPRVQALGLRIGVQLVKIRNPQCQIGVGEQLHRLRLGQPHEKRVDVLLDGSLLQKCRKDMRRFPVLLLLRIESHNDAGRVQIVVQRLGFPQKFRRKQDVLRVILRPDVLRVPDRYRRFDDHHGIRIDLLHQLDDRLHGRRVKIVLLRVVIRRRRNDDEIRIPVSRGPVGGCRQIQRPLREIPLNVLILNRRLPMIDLLHLLRKNVHRRHRIVLGQEGRQREPDVPGSRHCNADRVLLFPALCDQTPGVLHSAYFSLLFSRFPGSDRFPQEHIFQIKIQNISQCLKLCDGRNVFLRLDVAEHRTVDTGPFRQLLLGDAKGLSPCAHKIRQCFLR